MAKNTNKRIAIKHVRDRAKAAYTKKACCYICGTDEDLELHHTHGLQNLWDKWLKDNKYIADTDAQVLELRDSFIAQHHNEIYIDVFTLCVNHHRRLHAVYGKSPPLITAKKQSGWIEIQKNKFENPDKEQSLDTKKVSIWAKHLLK
jgi:hypothetical protein